MGTKIFISYSRKDSDFARQLNTALQAAGKTTWFDQESISTGVDFEKEIFKGIDGADNFVFVLSLDAVASEYCEREVTYAANKSKQVMDACEKAVALDSEQGYLRRSRGLARALTGNTQGAIKDFQFYVERATERQKEQTQGWLDALKNGDNPFTEEVLKKMR